MENKKLAIFVSGTGSLLEAMLEQGLKVDLVLADRPCRGIDEVAKKYNVPTEMVSRSDFKPFDREKFTEKIIEILDKNRIDLVAMAGFMTILSPIIFEKYKNRILNSHPSLLPLFKGDNAVADALANGNPLTGTTIHIATEKLDDGEFLAQEQVLILPEDTIESLHERIKQVERVLYPKVIRDYILKIN
ncbi:MAG: phosphoribosylglycinamide formyltransferase [bacterium]